MARSIQSEREQAYEEMLRVQDELLEEAGFAMEQPRLTSEVASVLRRFAYAMIKRFPALAREVGVVTKEEPSSV